MTDVGIHDAAREEWAEQISGLTLKHIKYALGACLDHYSEWPPNPGQFRDLCKMGEIEPDYQPPLLDNPTKPETLNEHVKLMKELLS